jgi:hypothetical protein
MVSEARAQTSRKNGALSKGPISPEGKEKSRRNGLKHGLTGQGIVVAEEDRDAIELRNEGLQQELAPQSLMGSILVGQMATLSVRMERGATQESAALATRVLHAPEAFDRERVDQAKTLYGGLAADPKTVLRELRKSPEGVDLLLAAWNDLREDPTRDRRPFWTPSHLVRMTNLMGRRSEDARESRIGDLSQAVGRNFFALEAHDGAGLNEADRMTWAMGKLVERIDEEIAGLKAHRESLDHATIKLDRQGAADRALFDPSREATLARRYESEARRGFFKALKEFRQVEAEAADQTESAPEAAPSPSQSREATRSSSRLGSCWEGDSTTPDDSTPAFEAMSQAPTRAVRDAVSPSPTANRPVSTTG